MNKGIIKKGLAIVLILILINMAPSICGTARNKTNNYNIDPIDEEVIFSDDFNDNAKDLKNWTELYNEGEWWERNGQTEFRLYEGTSHWRKEGIESLDIPITFDNNKYKIEAIMDTFVDNYPNQEYQYVGQAHMAVVDSSDPNSTYIDVYYRRDNNKIIVADSSGTSITLGTSNEFEYKVVITLESERYNVKVGPYDSGWISESIFSTEFDLNLQLFIQLAGDFAGYWWIAAFDDVYITEIQNDPPNAPTIDGIASGRVNIEYDYYFSATDPNEDELLYYIIWGDGDIEEWVGPFDSGKEVKLCHTWLEVGTYEIKAKVKDSFGIESDWSDVFEVSMIANIPPNPPVINGPSSGVENTLYTYTFVSEDPEDDHVFYEIVWGDGDTTGWIGPFKSNYIVTRGHIWDTKGSYTIMARSKDIFDDMSDWTEFEITIPRYRAKINLLYELFSGRFPILEELLLKIK